MRPAPVLAAILAAGLTFGLGVGAALSHLGPTALASDAAGPAADQASPSHGKGAPPDVPTELTATLAFGGDMLIHMPVANSARTGSGYDFSPLLAGVDPWIANADLAICQMETPVTPPGQSPSGFPIFAAPPELVADMAEQGWDGCTTASNHSVDKGWAGVEATIGALKDAGMGYSGTALSQEDSNQPQLYRISR
ncbi:MAG: CapA family protein, partial [Bifidobacteriaceae bacterium]|nr:CapA family protein [Bifidobacteriaceae bacterium]